MFWRDRLIFNTAKEGSYYWGVYQTADEARGSIPKRKRAGYDNDESANLYRDLIGKIFSHDYPLLFWLSRILSKGQYILDFGGHFGIKYYNFRKPLALDPSTIWAVYDLPTVVAAGRDWAKKNGEQALQFVDSYVDKTYDVFFASGSLQYLELSLGEVLLTMLELPKHVLIGSMPVNSSRYFTLQNIGVTICPYHIYSLDQTKEEMEKLGYELIDSWKEPEKSFFIPYYPRQSLKFYMGFYFRKRE